MPEINLRRFSVSVPVRTVVALAGMFSTHGIVVGAMYAYDAMGDNALASTIKEHMAILMMIVGGLTLLVMAVWYIRQTKDWVPYALGIGAMWIYYYRLLQDTGNAESLVAIYGQWGITCLVIGTVVTLYDFCKHRYFTNTHIHEEELP